MAWLAHRPPHVGPLFSCIRSYSSFYEPKPPSKTSSLRDILGATDDTATPSRLSFETEPSPQKSISLFFSEAIRSAVNHLSSNTVDVSHILSVHASRNNTIIHLADKQGATLIVTSPGQCGLKKANRGTGDAAHQATVTLLERAKNKEITPMGVHLKFKGFGPGRSQVLAALRASRWHVVKMTDTTPIRFAGCRPPKKRSL